MSIAFSKSLVLAVLFGASAASPLLARVEPRPVTPEMQKGLEWLILHQKSDGGWSQGEESAGMKGGSSDVGETSNLGDTCAALMALLRGGDPAHRAALEKGLAHVCKAVEESSPGDILVSKVRGTRLQAKLGQYVDTFLASLVLAEAKGRLENAELGARVEKALNRVVAKIEKNQKADGGFDHGGWAGALSQGLAAKSVNTAARKGAEVSEQTRGRFEKNATAKFDSSAGTFLSAYAAGVDLYASASSLGALQESKFANDANKDRMRALSLSASSTPAERDEARANLDRYERNERDLGALKQAVTAKLEDGRFVSGFGSNGGEEFLSYMQIGESLAAEGGETWQKWNEKTRANLVRVQNPDGSWSGHHCITGRSFCTSAALMAMMCDRAPSRDGKPLAAALK